MMLVSRHVKKMNQRRTVTNTNCFMYVFLQYAYFVAMYLQIARNNIRVWKVSRRYFHYFVWIFNFSSTYNVPIYTNMCKYVVEHLNCENFLIRSAKANETECISHSKLIVCNLYRWLELGNCVD